MLTVRVACCVCCCRLPHATSTSKLKKYDIFFMRLPLIVFGKDTKKYYLPDGLLRLSGDSLYWVGVIPVYFLKAVLKYRLVEKPVRSAISVIFRSLCRSSSIAFSIRSLLTYSLAPMPVSVFSRLYNDARLIPNS